MKLTAYDTNLKLSDPEPARAVTSGKRESYAVKNPGRYIEIRDYPGRAVSINTAYARMRRDPDMSLHDACMLPNKQNRNKKVPQVSDLYPIYEQVPSAYMGHLLSDRSNYRISIEWDVSSSAVARHRRLLEKQTNESTLPQSHG